MKRLLPILIVLPILFPSCAKQGYPDGGPKDTQPPTSLLATPANNTLNFAAPSFVIDFDEYIVLKSPDNNILVSPPLAHKPEYTAKGKRVIVKIQDTLQPNTTYLFQFKNAIADFTEGNELQSFEYAFSTGDHIDSMSIGGNVLDAQTYKPYEKEVTVLIYRLDEIDSIGDSCVVLLQPSYITRCNKDGSFLFSHIAHGNYKIVALEDGDRNLRLNGDEAVAFSDTAISSSFRSDSSKNDTQQITLRLSKPDHQVQRITKSTFLRHGRVEITSAAPMIRPVISCSDSLIWTLSPTKDTLNIWTYQEQLDSLQVIVNDESGLSDTLKMKFKEKKGKKHIKNEKKKINDASLIRSLSPNSIGFFDTLHLLFENPIVDVKDSSVVCLDCQDSTTSRGSIRVDSTQTHGWIDLDLASGHSYKVTIPSQTLTDIYQHTNDSLSFNVEILGSDKFGNIFILPTLNPDDNHIFQLTDENGKIIQSIPWKEGSKRVEFRHVKPGKYKIQVLFDNNHDGKWTPGDYWLHRQPETILFYNKTLDVRENWDIEEKWNLLDKTRK